MPVRRPCFRRPFPWPRPCTTSFPPEAMPPVKVHWYDGGLLPAVPTSWRKPRPGSRGRHHLRGGQGKMLVEGWGGEKPRLIPEPGQGLRPAAQDPAAFDRPPRGMDSGLQDGLAHLGLRLCRSAHGGGAAGERVHSQWRCEVEVGQPESEDHGRPGRQQACSLPIPRGVELVSKRKALADRSRPAASRPGDRALARNNRPCRVAWEAAVALFSRCQRSVGSIQPVMPNQRRQR